MHTEVARDLTTLSALLPPSKAPARIALESLGGQLHTASPDVAAALRHAADGLAAPEDDDAEERAILAAVAALLAPRPHLVDHVGHSCPVAADALVLVDLGDGQPYTEIARHIAWGPGVGPAGEGRVQRYALVSAAE